MSAFFIQILSLLLIYRYVVLFVVAFFGCFGLPVSSGPSIMAAAAFSGQDFFNIIWVIVSGSAGNICGDLTLYWLVRRYGRKALLWLRLRKLADSAALLNAGKTAETYKALAVIVSRFQGQATAVVNVVAGLAKMRFWRFALLVFAGEILQTIFYAAIGYFFADTWQTIYATMGNFSLIIALLLAFILILISSKITRKKLKY